MRTAPFLCLIIRARSSATHHYALQTKPHGNGIAVIILSHKAKLKIMANKDTFSRSALDYHCLYGKPGKIEVNPTKPLANQTDLALAYTPGVATICDAIVKDPLAARAYTARGNLVAVVTNWHSGFGAWQHRRFGRQAGHGRQGGIVQEIRRY